MPKPCRTDPVLVSALAVLFYAFFDLSKHHRALAAVNPFAEDPFVLAWLERNQLHLGAVFMVGVVCGLLRLLAASSESGGAPSWPVSRWWLQSMLGWRPLGC